MIVPPLLTTSGIPVDPTAPEARRWLQEELAKAPYEAARPTWFDQLSQAFMDWLNSLTVPSGGGFGAWIPLIITIVVVAVLVTAFLIFGLPRLNRRSHLSPELFGEDDRRSADDMRRAARAAAASGDWSLACMEQFRAIARSLAERTVLVVTPGTTAHHFARRAQAAFPAEGARLAESADLFDRVRYLYKPAGENDFRALETLDGDLGRTTPGAFQPPAAMVSS